MKRILSDLNKMSGGEFQDFLRWVPSSLLLQLLEEDRSELLLRRLEKELSPKAFQKLLQDLKQGSSGEKQLRRKTAA